MDYTMSILREPLTHWNPLGSIGKYRRECPAASETYFGSSVHSPQKTILFREVHWPRPASSNSISFSLPLLSLSFHPFTYRLRDTCTIYLHLFLFISFFFLFSLLISVTNLRDNEYEKERKKKWRCTLIGTCKHVDIGPLSSGPRTTMSSCFPSHKFLSAYHVFLSIPLCIFPFFSFPYLFKLDFLSFLIPSPFFSFLSSMNPFYCFFFFFFWFLFSSSFFLHSAKGIFQTFASLRIILSYLFLGPSPLDPLHFPRSFSPPFDTRSSGNTSISELSTRSYTCESESVLHPH